MNRFLEAAWKRREEFLEDLKKQNTNCFRLFCGAKEGIPGTTIDVLGETAILYQLEGAGKAFEPTDLLQRKIVSVYKKTLVSNRTKTIATHASKDPLCGEIVPSELIVTENGFKFMWRPYDGFLTGLFLDQRENRRFLGLRSRGKKVLNLFSYTCAFSVYAAKCGGEVTSVDMSRKALEWGKRNFELNKESGHRFLCEDARVYLDRAYRRGERFDLVILDPPTFSKSNGKPFSLQKGVSALVSQVERILSAGGEFFFSSNFEGWTQPQMNRLVETSAPGLRSASGATRPTDFLLSEKPLLSSFWTRA